MHISAGWSYLQELNVEVKPSRLLPACFFYRGRCPRLPTSASRCVLPSRQIIPFFTLRSSLKQWVILVYRLIVFWEACAPLFLSIAQKTIRGLLGLCLSTRKNIQVNLMFFHSFALSLDKIGCTRKNIQVNLMFFHSFALSLQKNKKWKINLKCFGSKSARLY